MSFIANSFSGGWNSMSSEAFGELAAPTKDRYFTQRSPSAYAQFSDGVEEELTFDANEWSIELKLVRYSAGNTVFIAGSSERNNTMVLDYTSGTLRLFAYKDEVLYNDLLSVVALALNTQYHIEITYLNGAVKIYVNDSLKQTGTWPDMSDASLYLAGKRFNTSDTQEGLLSDLKFINGGNLVIDSDLGAAPGEDFQVNKGDPDVIISNIGNSDKTQMYTYNEGVYTAPDGFYFTAYEG